MAVDISRWSRQNWPTNQTYYSNLFFVKFCYCNSDWEPSVQQASCCWPNLRKEELIGTCHHENCLCLARTVQCVQLYIHHVHTCTSVPERRKLCFYTASLLKVHAYMYTVYTPLHIVCNNYMGIFTCITYVLGELMTFHSTCTCSVVTVRPGPSIKSAALMHLPT